MGRLLNISPCFWIAWLVLGLAISHVLWGTTEASFASWICGEADEVTTAIMTQIRIPRVLTAMGAGAGLGVCGLLLQTWFGNPLAGPSVLGISSGAGMGVALVVLAGFAGGWVATASAAVLGSLLVLFGILLVAQRFRGMTTLLIFGLMLNYVLGALMTILQAEAKQDALQQFVFWGMGTFGQNTLFLAASLIVLVVIVVARAWHLKGALDAWTLGGITARSMGVSDKAVRWNLLLLTGLTTGAVTAICGPVAFLGLATPHVVRSFTGRRTHGFLIPMTALCGAALALLADWGVKGFGGGIDGWPLNAVLSLLGGPMVIWVLIKRGWTPE